ncbi:MAG: hypothetical protein OXR68_05150 [Alphaproteobacteria bacterium]|nr:hypothetical protein [Alphaproteobacteria bacterium]MDD9919990.1 hypothetical protein [Alphaproteobacteria bacterium]
MSEQQTLLPNSPFPPAWKASPTGVVLVAKYNSKPVIWLGRRSGGRRGLGTFGIVAKIPNDYDFEQQKVVPYDAQPSEEAVTVLRDKTGISGVEEMGLIPTPGFYYKFDQHTGHHGFIYAPTAQQVAAMQLNGFSEGFWFTRKQFDTLLRTTLQFEQQAEVDGNPANDPNVVTTNLFLELVEAQNSDVLVTSGYQHPVKYVFDRAFDGTVMLSELEKSAPLYQG